MPERSWTVAEILATTTDFLGKKDPSCPRLEAELLLSRILKLNRVSLYLNFERVLTPPEIAAYRVLVRRRGNHEPVAYILGQKEFYKLPLKVTPATLIPRPETEHLVDEALRFLRQECHSAATDDSKLGEAKDEAPDESKDFGQDNAPKENPLAADVGTGSGAVALALLSSHPTLKVVATDISPEALEVAKENAKTHKLIDRVTFLQGHLSEPLAGRVFDLICANLPYIPDADMATLAPDVAMFEPKLALSGGPDGLDLIAAFLANVKPLLKVGGHLVLEIWPDSVVKLHELARSAGLEPQEPVLDLSMKARIFVAKKQSSA
jgi:release factor glutamine methyltransferase